MLHKAEVTIEGMYGHTAYVEEGTWNGWLCPWFTKEEADAMNVWLDEMFGSELVYDPKLDVFICDGEQFKGKDIEVDGATMHLYPIGNGSWVWQEVQA